jgi:hypothetical protein
VFRIRWLYQKNREFREHQEQLVLAAQDAELGLAQPQLNELVSLVDIYRNLGGGWEP